ncbi:MAG: hypothetical protein SF187_07695 [Deltaproteobacteria bacterium]|nr:hypothetical protein [Deltaproteobacteria bacterium]
MKFGYLTLLFIACGVACSPESRPDGASTGDAGVPTDASSGGAGGGTAGGAGGRATGGAGGAGGIAGAAGMSGGAGGGAGSANGGAAGGMAGMGMTGGMAGMAPPPPPPGPVEKPTAASFFSGKTNAPSKLVSRDVNPGYFYAVQPFGSAPSMSVVTLAEGDLTGLPAGITFAQKASTVTMADSQLLIAGFNFRADDDKKWRWIDATDFAGLSFWAKVATGMIEGSTTTVDATNVLATDPAVGTCAAAPCVSVHGKIMTVTATWTQFKFKWSDFTLPVDATQGPVETKQLGRIDLLFGVPANTAFDLFVTGVQLATAAELN